MRLFATFSLTALLAAGAATGAMAQTFAETDSVTVNASGVTPASGYTDSNIDVGSATAHYGATFGVLDFAGYAAPTNAASINSLTVTLSQYTNSYATAGSLDFFIAGSPTPVTGNDDPAVFNSSYTAGATDGINAALTPVLLGSSSYVVGGKGTPSSYTFSLSSAAEMALQKDFTNKDVQIYVGTASGGTTQAEFDGVYYTNGGGSSNGDLANVTFAATPAAVPEASTTVSFGLLLAFGLSGLVVSRRRKAA